MHHETNLNHILNLLFIYFFTFKHFLTLLFFSRDIVPKCLIITPLKNALCSDLVVP